MSELVLSSSIPSADVVCPRHPKTKMFITCSRCGSFVCQDCVALIGDGSQCEPCIQRQVAELPSLKARAKIATWGMFAWIATCIAQMPISFDGRELEPSPWSALALLAFLFMIITEVVLFCRWFHLAVRHAVARGHSVGFTPEAAVGSWFIPYLNLIRPFEIARGLLSWRERPTAIVGVWQGLWVLGNIANQISSRVENTWLVLAAEFMLIGAGILCIKVMNEISEEPIEST